ncbi:MAG: 6-phosphofructokinase [Planctomycetes bacterium]|nr:6-phosphofructokinase [Planctomycetota bacterium]
MSGKGNAIVAQSGGPTCAINASVCGVIQEAMGSGRIGKIFGADNGILGVLREELFDISAEAPETIEALKQTPSAAIGSCRYKLKAIDESKADFERVLEVFRAHEVHYFFYAGGNDSMDTADKINKLAADSGYELVCMGVPKTIDNDLPFTDHCPGYGSVARYVAISAMEAGRDTESLYTADTCTILEVMGRNAGWIAAASGLASRTERDAPHLIYMPEIPFSVDNLVDDVREALGRLRGVFIVVGEGIRDEKGNFLAEDTGAFGTDSFGHKQLGGAAAVVKAIIEKEVGIKARWNLLGTHQRSAMHCASLTDVEEAHLCGQMAVRCALNGENGKMITLVRESDSPYHCSTGVANLGDVANSEKKVPREFINDRGNHVTEALRDYVAPLMRGQADIDVGPDGLPRYVRLVRHAVARKTGRADSTER